jgi:hypothetical protein
MIHQGFDFIGKNLIIGGNLLLSNRLMSHWVDPFMVSRDPIAPFGVRNFFTSFEKQFETFVQISSLSDLH